MLTLRCIPVGIIIGISKVLRTLIRIQRIATRPLIIPAQLVRALLPGETRLAQETADNAVWTDRRPTILHIRNIWGAGRRDVVCIDTFTRRPWVWILGIAEGEGPPDTVENLDAGGAAGELVGDGDRRDSFDVRRGRDNGGGIGLKRGGAEGRKSGGGLSVVGQTRRGLFDTVNHQAR